MKGNHLVGVWERGRGLFVCWLLNIPATCECISGTEGERGCGGGRVGVGGGGGACACLVSKLFREQYHFSMIQFTLLPSLERETVCNSELAYKHV